MAGMRGPFVIRQPLRQKFPNARNHFRPSSRWLACCCVIDPGSSRSRARCWPCLESLAVRCNLESTLPRIGEHAMQSDTACSVVPDRMFVAELRRENACHSPECFCRQFCRQFCRERPRAAAASPSGQDSVPGPPCGCRLALPIRDQSSALRAETANQIKPAPTAPRPQFRSPHRESGGAKAARRTTRGYGRSRRHNWVCKSAGCRDSTPLGPRRTRRRIRCRIRRNMMTFSAMRRCGAPKMFHAD